MKHFFLSLFLIFSSLVLAQKSLSNLLKTYNSESVPYISIQELAMQKTNTVLLDARELPEYEVSHLKNAIHVGYNDFDLDEITKNLADKDQVIVVYCSLGIRSETIAQKLKNNGYANVYNLYGGIFEWKNNNFEVYNSQGKVTDSVHAFSKAWDKWLKKGIKVYE